MRIRSENEKLIKMKRCAIEWLCHIQVSANIKHNTTQYADEGAGRAS